MPGLPWWLTGKESACQCRVQSLGWEDPLEEETEPHSSILAWEIPWTEEAGGPQSMRSQESGSTEVTQHTCTPTGRLSQRGQEALPRSPSRSRRAGLDSLSPAPGVSAVPWGGVCRVTLSLHRWLTCRDVGEDRGRPQPLTWLVSCPSSPHLPAGAQQTPGCGPGECGGQGRPEL